MTNSRFEINLNNRQELATALPRFLIAAGDLSVKAGDTLIFNSFELTTGKFALLATLASIDTIPTMTELKDKVIRSSAHLTQSVDALEKEGFVRRVASPTDRRVHLIEITTEGRKKYEAVQDFLEHQMNDFMSEFSTDELKSFLLLLGKFIGITSRALDMENLCRFEGGRG